MTGESDLDIDARKKEVIIAPEMLPLILNNKKLSVLKLSNEIRVKSIG